MDASRLPADLRKAVAFHGHLCPGLMIGWRAVRTLAAHLEVGASPDEELVTVAENDSCSVDAFQALLATTFGKGNLIHRDLGKQAFTLLDRRRGRAARAVFLGDGLKKRDARGQTDREAFMAELLTRPARELFAVRDVALPAPPPARIEKSRPCAACGEMTQPSRLVAQADGRELCRACAGKA